MDFRTPNGIGTGTDTGTDIVVTKPSAVSNGDLLIVVIYHDDATMDTVPSGWTLVGSIENTTAPTHFFIRMYWKRASSEGASWTWVIGTSGWFAWTVAAYTGGLASGDAINGTPTTAANNDSGYTIDAPSITTTVDGAMVVAGAGNYPGLTWSSGESPCTNERSDANGLMLYDGIKTTAGATGALTFTTASGSGDHKAVVMCALKPAAASSTSIKKIAGVAQASLQDVGMVAAASIKKVSGVSNTA